MINTLLNRKKEAVKIFWNEELFKGMTRSEIINFKNKNRKLVVKYYKLSMKCQKAEKELFEARDKFLASKNVVVKNNNLKLKLTVGGLVLATVCAVGTVKSNAVTSTDVNATVKTVELAEVENIATIEELVAEIPSTVLVEENSINSVDEAIAEEITEVVSDTTFDTEVSNEIAYTTIESIENTTSNDVVSFEDAVIEEDFIIFDKALEMLDARCSENYNGTVFSGLSNSTHIPLMGNYILPHYEDSASRKVAEWFEAFFGSEVTTHSLRYDSSFKIKAGGVKFESLEGGFTATIDTNAIDVLVNLNLQDSIDASIRGGVSQEVRDALTSQKYLEFMPSLDKMFEAQHENIKQSLVGSESLLGNIKFSVEKELKDLTGWDVTVKFN